MQAHRCHDHAHERYQRGGLVAHDPLLQAQQRAKRGGQANGEQADRRGLRHAQPEPEHQYRYRKYAAPGPGQREHRADHEAQRRAQ